MTTKNATIALQGGLGNQLFQMSAVLSLQTNEVRLECEWGNPRRTEGIEDIFYFDLDSSILRSETKLHQKFISKGFNFMLRSHLERKSRIFRETTRGIWESLVNILLSKNYYLQVGDNLGFYPLKSSTGKEFLIHGYFQSYRYLQLPLVNSRMQNISLKSPPNELSKFSDLAKVEKPLVVHVRRGDYTLESNFGLLGSQYYEEALFHLWGMGTFGKIWLFSDEPDTAVHLIPQDLKSEVRIIPSIDSVPATTLELMRLGYGYVIANSSFSWWGAALSKSVNPVVVAPAKWFKGMEDPKELIPPHWKKINSYFL